MPIKPKKGDKVALIGTSGSITKDRLDQTVVAMNKLGFDVEVAPSCYLNHGYLSGSDEQRAKDINEMFSRNDIKGIFVMRGGYGCHRLMNLLDFETIKNNAKFFCGYSDVTALHIAFNQICGFSTYHTLMPATQLYKGLDEYSEYYYKKVVFEEEFNCTLKNPLYTPMETLVGGFGQGVITGGNLSLITATLGTFYEIDTKNKILLIEEVEEEFYKIDGKINHLRNSGKLHECNGIILGGFTRCYANNEAESLTLLQIFNELIKPLNIPTIMNVSIGHCYPTMSIPLGVNVKINADKCEIVFGG